MYMKQKDIASRKWKVLVLAFFISHSSFLICEAQAQTFETRYERSVNDLMKDVARRFGVKFKPAVCRFPRAPLFVGDDARQHLQILRLELVETEWQLV